MDPQFFGYISASVDKWQKVAPLFVAGMGALYIIYICTITESLSIIRNRISDLIGIKHSFSHEKLKKHQQQELDLEYFNFKFKLNVKTPYAMDKLITWADRSGVRLNEIKRARPYFNPTEQTFKIPQPKFTKTFIVMVLLFAALVFSAIYTPNAALFKVNKTGQWFWVTDSHAFSFTSYLPQSLHASNSWEMSTGNCLLDNTPAPLSSEWDKQVICSLLLDNQKGRVAKTIGEQKILAWTFSLPWLLVPLAVLQGSHRRRYAIEFQKRSQKKLRFGDSPLPEYARYYYE
ncbi:DUF6216 family protein [Pseudomonas sp. PDM04]|uniref:DUF6216 family protein n=1 Tax=Pseudomonas sp. PDM04 TaxID=2769296 RepID=UPI00177B5901|nr:DUF6216 family protein [Pseudomonas sp. PDM04]MBD9439410.1 hypothetical protein [Pseudomonas sp. PDM04]